METYGTDALRYTMMLIAPHGQDLLFSNEQVEVGRNFANKMWNAARLVLMHQSKWTSELLQPENLWDRWIQARLNKTIEQATHSLEKYAFHETALLLFDFFKHDYCDWYLEVIKERLYDKSDLESAQYAGHFATQILEQVLRLLHPFMPFITEEIWQQLKPGARPDTQQAKAAREVQDAQETQEVHSIVRAPWPLVQPLENAQVTEADVLSIQELVGAIRGVRADFRVHPSREMQVYCRVENQRLATMLVEEGKVVKSLAKSELVFVDEESDRPIGSASGVLREMEFYVPLSDLIDLETETERLSKERTRVEKELEKVKKRLANDQFVIKAPAEVVEKEKNKQTSYKDMIGKLNRNLEMIGA